MFLTQISIQNKLAIRDGFVEIPGSMKYRQTLTEAEVLTLIPGSVAKRETCTKYIISDEKWIELPTYSPSAHQPDYYQTLRTAAAAKIVT